MTVAGPALSFTLTCFCFLETDLSASALRGADCFVGCLGAAVGAPMAGRAPMERERFSGSVAPDFAGAWVVARGGKPLAGPAGFGLPHLVPGLPIGCCLARAVASDV
eukprot:913302-Amphidinium_carterae.1